MNCEQKDAKSYILKMSQSGDIVPAICNNENYQPLHSMIDPKREAQRLLSTIEKDTGFLIFFGLGGGYLPEAALEQTNAFITVIDFGRNSIDELLAGKDYSKLLKNSRFNLLIDPSYDEIKSYILEHYKPALYGGIKTIPLRARVEPEKHLFDRAAAAISDAIEAITSDYSVQAHFGKRWFSNIIRNIKYKKNNDFKLKIEGEAAIVAAGPSLDMQIPSLVELKKRGVFIISSDTASLSLLHNEIIPDAIVSIDCQHISYYHFLSTHAKRSSISCSLPSSIPLFLDIASPPGLSQIPGYLPVFFSGGHPLAGYFSKTRQMPIFDTSGGNVTYACLSLAESLNAKSITVFGADFSYINSQSYARGTYIYPHFYKRQNRICSLETLFSKFLYRSPFLPPENNEKKMNFFETSSLRFYRKKFEEKIAAMSVKVNIAHGFGAPVIIEPAVRNNQTCGLQTEGVKTCGLEQSNRRFGTVEPMVRNDGIKFLKQYLNDIAALPQPDEKENYLKKLNEKQAAIFITLLPCAANIRKKNPGLGAEKIIEEVKRFCIEKIEQVLKK